jgi:hypothetical protein
MMYFDINQHEEIQADQGDPRKRPAHLGADRGYS